MSKASAREISGVTATSEGQAFDAKSILNLKNKPTFKGTRSNRPKHIGVFVDPNAGGSSHMAIISLCQVEGRLILCGVDSHSVKTVDDERHLFYSHIKAIREDEWMRDAYIVLFAERGTGHTSGHLANVLAKEFDRVAWFNQPSANQERKAHMDIKEGKKTMIQFEKEYEREAVKDPGFRTQDTKPLFRVEARKYLKIGGVSWLHGCVCSNPFLRKLNHKIKLKMTKDILHEQLNRCKVFSKRPTSELSIAKESWSGKCNDEGERQDGYEDDIAVMFAAACFFWPKAMAGELVGFPYSKVDMNEEDSLYHLNNRKSYAIVNNK